MGVIPWLYMAEIMTNSGMSAGVVTNQALTLLISSISNSLISSMNGWAFIMFGIISGLVSNTLLPLCNIIGYHLPVDLHERNERTLINVAAEAIPPRHERHRLRDGRLSNSLSFDDRLHTENSETFKLCVKQSNQAI